MASHGGVVSLTNPGFELVTWEQGIGPYTAGPLQPQRIFIWREKAFPLSLIFVSTVSHTMFIFVKNNVQIIDFYYETLSIRNKWSFL